MTSSWRRGIVGAAALTVLVGFGVLPAQGATVWTSRPAPPDGGLSLSCVSTSDCRTVSYTQGENPKPVAQSWDGAHWSVQNIPVPPGTHSAALTGLDCL